MRAPVSPRAPFSETTFLVLPGGSRARAKNQGFEVAGRCKQRPIRGSSKRRSAVARAIWLVHSRSSALVSRQRAVTTTTPGQFGPPAGRRLRHASRNRLKPAEQSGLPADASTPARTLRR